MLCQGSMSQHDWVWISPSNLHGGEQLTSAIIALLWPHQTILRGVSTVASAMVCPAGRRLCLAPFGKPASEALPFITKDGDKLDVSASAASPAACFCGLMPITEVSIYAGVLRLSTSPSGTLLSTSCCRASVVLSLVCWHIYPSLHLSLCL